MAVGTVAYFSPFVPAEWIAAHGFEPWRVVPGGAGLRGSQARAAPPEHGSGTEIVPDPWHPAAAGVCPFAHDFLMEVMGSGATAVIFASTCDQMRRMAEFAMGGREGRLPTLLMHVPATWQTAAAQEFYAAELRRLSRFLVELGGEKPSHERLVEAMLAYDLRRGDLSRDRKGATGTASELSHGRSLTVAAQIACIGMRVALVGGPLRQQDGWILQHIRKHGGEVVLDASETGERCLPAVYQEAAVREDPLRELVRAYFRSIPDVFRRPDTLMQEYLRREIERRRVQGVLLIRCVWCDLWHAQVGRLKESLGVPMVEIDLGQDDRDLQRIQTRIDALLDMAR
ncbi:MAG: 2-hydroxyacyl-CoA dehydratase family protein [Phycisphaerales bacterium]|nr:2-hydroxyacyl-CoA dehydratase family protein [Phycisphaerales bacterium]